MRLICSAFLVLLGAGLATAQPLGVFSAKTSKASEAKVLGAFSGARVIYRTTPSKGRVMTLFVADDRNPSSGEAKTVKRVTALAARPLSLYRARFKVRYGALPLPKGDGCSQKSGLSGLIEGPETQREACMQRAVREALVKATDTEARKVAGLQIETILNQFRSPDPKTPAPTVVSRRIRTYLVKTPEGERQEAEVELLLVAMTWPRPFENVPATSPVVEQTLEKLVAVR